MASRLGWRLLADLAMGLMRPSLRIDGRCGWLMERRHEPMLAGEMAHIRVPG